MMDSLCSLVYTNLVFTCSKLTKETLEQGLKYVQSQQTKANGVILVSLLLTLNLVFLLSTLNFKPRIRT